MTSGAAHAAAAAAPRTPVWVRASLLHDALDLPPRSAEGGDEDDRRSSLTRHNSLPAGRFSPSPRTKKNCVVSPPPPPRLRRRRSRSLRNLRGGGGEEEGGSSSSWGWVRGWLQAAAETTTEIVVRDENASIRLRGRTIRVPSPMLRIGEADDELVGRRIDGSSDGRPAGEPPNVLVANPSELAEEGHDDDDRSLDVRRRRPPHPHLHLPVPPEDLVELTHLHEPAVVHSLRTRYDRDVIYTSTGPILLAVNPFKECRGVYSTERMEEYSVRGERDADGGGGGLVGGGGGGRGAEINGDADDVDGEDDEDEDEDAPLPPHIYQTADRAYRLMLRGMEEGETSSTVATDQSILVSGESGAGKTVTTKFVMEYLSSLSRRHRMRRRLQTAGGGGMVEDGRDEGEEDDAEENEEIAIEDEVLQSNPILESFGNARTVRNDNSSRFGKFIELQFGDTRSGPDGRGHGDGDDGGGGGGGEVHLIGASIETYLLEKVRLLPDPRRGHGGGEERNYHVLYEVLAGATPEERERWRISSDDDDATTTTGTSATLLDDFVMTRGTAGDGRPRDGVDDGDSYRALRRAMNTIGLTPEEQEDVFTVTCALLHLSNLTFIPTGGLGADDGGDRDVGGGHNEEGEIERDRHVYGDGSAIDVTNPSLSHASHLLGVSVDAVGSNLCTHAIRAGGGGGSDSGSGSGGPASPSSSSSSSSSSPVVVTTLLSPRRAREGLEALLKATYDAMFAYLVRRINALICARHRHGDARGAGKRGGGRVVAAYIGLLDIFGFESFEHNSFEQLCINYCNEALQQQFNRFVFKNEQLEYEREGIQWSFIEFPDNQDVLDLIDARGSGILSILDDQCKVPGTTDRSFVTDAHRKCSNHRRFQANDMQLVDISFEIQHYAGCVEYDASGFVSKNRDELPGETMDLLASSSRQFVRTLGCIIRERAREAGSSANATKRTTVGGQFTSQLARLRRRIDSTHPHYVRCLKPNDDLVPDNFDTVMIADQLKCSGVLEAVRVSRVGYPHRYKHAVFLKRYGLLLQAARRKGTYADFTKTGLHHGCRVLIDAVVSPQPRNTEERIDGDSSRDESCPITAGVQVGRTKVFLRSQAFHRLELLRNRKMLLSITTVQACVRKFLALAHYQHALDSILVLQCAARQFVARGIVYSMRCERAATLLEKVWRTVVNRHRFTMTVHLCLWSQKMYRGHLGRSRFHRQLSDSNATLIGTWWRASHCRRDFRKWRQAVVIVQCSQRCCMARTRLRRLKLAAKDVEALRNERDDLRLMLREAKNQLHGANMLTTEESNDEVASTVAEVKAELSLKVEELRNEAKQAADALIAEKEAALAEADKCRREAEFLKAELEAARQSMALLQSVDRTTDTDAPLIYEFGPLPDNAFDQSDEVYISSDSNMGDIVPSPRHAIAKDSSRDRAQYDVADLALRSEGNHEYVSEALKLNNEIHNLLRADYDNISTHESHHGADRESARMLSMGHDWLPPLEGINSPPCEIQKVAGGKTNVQADPNEHVHDANGMVSIRNEAIIEDGGIYADRSSRRSELPFGAQDSMLDATFCQENASGSTKLGVDTIDRVGEANVMGVQDSEQLWSDPLTYLLAVPNNLDDCALFADDKETPRLTGDTLMTPGGEGFKMENELLQSDATRENDLPFNECTFTKSYKPSGTHSAGAVDSDRDGGDLGAADHPAATSAISKPGRGPLSAPVQTVAITRSGAGGTKKYERLSRDGGIERRFVADTQKKNDAESSTSIDEAKNRASNVDEAQIFAGVTDHVDCEDISITCRSMMTEVTSLTTWTMEDINDLRAKLALLAASRRENDICLDTINQQVSILSEEMDEKISQMERTLAEKQPTSVSTKEAFFPDGDSRAFSEIRGTCASCSPDAGSGAKSKLEHFDEIHFQKEANAVEGKSVSRWFWR